MYTLKFFLQRKPKSDHLFGIWKDRKQSVDDLIRSMRKGRNFDR